MAEGAVGIAPTTERHVPAEILNEIEVLKERIITGDIRVPHDENTYLQFIQEL